MGHPIHFYQDGEGPCAGTSAAPAPAPAPDGAETATAPAADAGPELEAATDAAAEQPAPILPMRSLGDWVVGLKDDGWGIAAFTAAILSGEPGPMRGWAALPVHAAALPRRLPCAPSPRIAVLGGTAMAWSFVFDAVADLRSCCAKR